MDHVTSLIKSYEKLLLVTKSQEAETKAKESKLRKEILDKQRAFEAKETELDVVAMQKQKLGTEVVSLKNINMRLLEEANDKDTEMETLRDENEQLKMQVEALEHYVREAIGKAEYELTKHQQASDKAYEDEAESHRHTLLTASKEFMSWREHMEERLTAKDNIISKMRDKLDSRKLEVHQLQLQAVQVQLQMEQQQEEHEKQISELRSEIVNRFPTRSDIATWIDTAVDSVTGCIVSECTDRLEVCQLEHNERLRQVSRLLRGLTTEMDSKSRQASDGFNNVISELRIRNDTLNTQHMHLLETLESERCYNEMQRSQSQNQLTRLMQELDRLRVENLPPSRTNQAVTACVMTTDVGCGTPTAPKEPKSLTADASVDMSKGLPPSAFTDASANTSPMAVNKRPIDLLPLSLKGMDFNSEMDELTEFKKSLSWGNDAPPQSPLSPLRRVLTPIKRNPTGNGPKRLGNKTPTATPPTAPMATATATTASHGFGCQMETLAPKQRKRRGEQSALQILSEYVKEVQWTRQSINEEHQRIEQLKDIETRATGYCNAVVQHTSKGRPQSPVDRAQLNANRQQEVDDLMDEYEEDINEQSGDEQQHSLPSFRSTATAASAATANAASNRHTPSPTYLDDYVSRHIHDDNYTDALPPSLRSSQQQPHSRSVSPALQGGRQSTFHNSSRLQQHGEANLSDNKPHSSSSLRTPTAAFSSSAAATPTLLDADRPNPNSNRSTPLNFPNISPLSAALPPASASAADRDRDRRSTPSPPQRPPLLSMSALFPLTPKDQSNNNMSPSDLLAESYPSSSAFRPSPPPNGSQRLPVGSHALRQPVPPTGGGAARMQQQQQMAAAAPYQRFRTSSPSPQPTTTLRSHLHHYH